MQRIWGSVRQGIVADEVETPIEFYPNDRERLRFRQYRAVAQLACLRHQQFYDIEQDEEPLRQDELDRRVSTGALAGRQCPFFFSYRPGYSPRDHLLLQGQSERLREERAWGARHLLAALLIALGGMLLGILLILALAPGRGPTGP